MTRAAYRAVVGLCAMVGVASVAMCGGGSPTASISGTTTKPDTTTNIPTGTIPARGFYLRYVTFDGKQYPYQVFIPQGYTPAKKWPVLVFLHGGNDVGSDGYKQLSVGLGPYINNHLADFPAIAVFPQMSAETGGVGRENYISTVILSLDATIKEFPGVDNTRIYLQGLSFGGIQGFEIAYRNPTRFAAFNPISAFLCNTCITGVANAPQMAYDLYTKTLPTMPYWQYQGDKDTQIPTNEVRAFVQTYQATDKNAKYVEVAGADHNTTYPIAYSNQAMWDWLWAQHR